MSRRSSAQAKKITASASSYEDIRNSLSLKDMCFQENRLQSFEKWPKAAEGNKCNPKTLAEAGFYYYPDAGDPDTVRCFVSDKCLSSWNVKTDDPLREHQSHEPTCPFIKMGKTESEMTMKELTDLLSESRLYRLDRGFEIIEKNYREAVLAQQDEWKIQFSES